MLRGKFIAIQAFLKKEKKSQIDNLTQHLNELGKKEQIKSKVSKREEVIFIREETKKVEMQKTIEKIKNESLFFENGNKIDKPLARLTQKMREITQIKKIKK